MVRRYRQRIQGTISPKAYDIVMNERESGRLFNHNLSKALETIILEWDMIPLKEKAHQDEYTRLVEQIKELEENKSPKKKKRVK
ncbi:unnamed protein product [marine sediment metagenome]|uniref:Uncharacterized protein n=1 Tax=marine sediment metagenome TaxID=412755 RepID=X1N607_9ZZZZ